MTWFQAVPDDVSDPGVRPGWMCSDELQGVRWEARLLMAAIMYCHLRSPVPGLIVGSQIAMAEAVSVPQHVFNNLLIDLALARLVMVDWRIGACFIPIAVRPSMAVPRSARRIARWRHVLVSGPQSELLDHIYGELYVLIQRANPPALRERLLDIFCGRKSIA